VLPRGSGGDINVVGAPPQTPGGRLARSPPGRDGEGGLKKSTAAPIWEVVLVADPPELSPRENLVANGLSPGHAVSCHALPNVLAGAISGTLILSYGISFAALIFTGHLARYLPAGIGVLLASSFVLGAIVALRSSYRPMIAAPQENTSVILALVAAQVARKLGTGAGALPTLIATFGVASICTGALFFLLGRFRLGKIVRFIPYPVVGGFLAGTGWLLVQGSLSVMSGLTVTAAEVPQLFERAALARWIPGLAFGLVLTAVLRRPRHVMVLPAMLAGGTGLFYAAVRASGLGASGAMAKGLLLGPFASGSLWPPITPARLAEVDWSAVRGSACDIAACAVLAGISLLLNAAGLELATEQDLDIDRELRITGVANVVAGLLGGVPGYLSLGESTLNHKAGARSRAPGLISAGLCAVALVAGTQVIAYVPKAILGGMLLYLGLSFLIETVYDAWFRLPRGEHALVLLILGVVVTLGFIQGVGAGIVVASFLFALNYARIDVVKHAISGAGLRSKAGRSPADEAILQETGACVHVLQLQGYLFFGTAFQLLHRVRERLLAAEPLPARFIVLDFRHVDGLDSSAVATFARMRKLAEARGALLLLTSLPPSVRRQIERGGCLREGEDGEDGGSIRTFADLDHGIEWCEEQLLADVAGSRASSGAPACEPEAATRQGDLVARLCHLEYLARVEAPEGFDLYAKGDASHDLYFIESGELEAFIDLADGHSLRLRTMGKGSVVGESGLYLGTRRSASVRTTRPTVLYRLSLAELDRMKARAPEVAAAFHQFVARLLADRLVHTTSAAQLLFY
jgi:sulfate permease, SulP family